MSKQQIENLVNIIFEQWENIKGDLNTGAVKYNDSTTLVDKYTFFHQFDDLFQNTCELLEVKLSDIKQMYRGVSGEVELEDYGRMIPKVEYAKGHNRMNPPGEAFLYAGVLGEDKGKEENITKPHIVKTVLKEIRASKDSKATICKFEANELAKDKKIINICGDPSIPMIEPEMSNYLYRKTVKRFSVDQARLASLIASVYFNIFSNEQVFKPINTTEQEVRQYEYAAFHALANYIREQGYAGMIFRSTVHQNGTNLVLFDPTDVSVVHDSMEHINTSEYLG